jgi:hypothetical protein
MKTIAVYLKKSLLVLLLAMLSLGTLPVTPTYAAGLPNDPVLAQGKDYFPRLEMLFELQQERFDHQTQVLERIPTFIDRIQRLIDRATAKGVDASAVQAALDDFSAAIPAAQSAHDQAAALIAAHTGFDEKGMVTNLAAAVQTVKAIHQANLGYTDALLPSFRTLRQAIRTFVQENKLSQLLNPTATP